MPSILFVGHRQTVQILIKGFGIRIKMQNATQQPLLVTEMDWSN